MLAKDMLRGYEEEGMIKDEGRETIIVKDEERGLIKPKTIFWKV